MTGNEAPADREHVEHHDRKEGQPDQGELEETEWFEPRRIERVAHHDVRWGPGEGEEATGVGGEGERDEDL